MIILIVNITVKPEFVKDFIFETKLLKFNTLAEPGCHGYDVLRNNGADNEFVFVEKFKQGSSLEKHKNSEHFKRWKEKTFDMIENKSASSFKNI